MGNVQLLVFILVGLGIFVWRMLKQAAETTARELRERPRRPGSEATPALPDASFQELLRQMQSQNQGQNQPPPAPVSPVPPAPASSRPVRPVRPAAARSLERAKTRPVSLEEPATSRASHPPAPHARRAATLPRAATVAPIDDYWARKNRPASPAPDTSRSVILAALRNPVSARAAFVLGEILRRPA